jgi:hypothetical protein
MHTINDIIIFLSYYKENKLKINKEHFLEAVSCVKNYKEFKLVLDLFKDAGLKVGIRFYDDIVKYICSYKDCREILDYLKDNAAKVNRGYFMQLMLLSTNKEDARQIYNEFLNQNTRTILAESLIEGFGDEEQVMENFHEKSRHEYSIRGFKFRERVDNIKKVIFVSSEITETEKEQLNKSRIGQSVFKKALLSKAKKCGLCGVSDERFLIASHIKPWSHSSNQERLDVDNGLLLCPNHDSLFDKGYISFDEEGTILMSYSLDKATKVFLNINEILNINLNECQQEYMKWHRENVYKI